MQHTVLIKQTRNSKPKTRNPKLETRNQNPKPKPKTRNSKLETRNPKPKPKTRNFTTTRDNTRAFWLLFLFSEAGECVPIA
jgi:hypothetical protein